MPYSITNTPDGIILRLDGAVTIRDAHDLGAKLAESLDEGTSFAVDTSDLEDVDTCILQLLCSLRKTVPTLSFRSPGSPSEAFTSAADRCGLRRELLGSRESS